MVVDGTLGKQDAGVEKGRKSSQSWGRGVELEVGRSKSGCRDEVCGRRGETGEQSS